MTDARDLKIMALKEVIASDKATYEDRIADLRVALTQKDEELEQSRQHVAVLEAALTEFKQDEMEEPDVMEGEVVE